MMFEYQLYRKLHVNKFDSLLPLYVKANSLIFQKFITDAWLYVKISHPVRTESSLGDVGFNLAKIYRYFSIS